MSYKRTIVCGDVHGCIEELDELLLKVQYTPADRLVFLGDLMDRGPDPVGCVKRIRALKVEVVKGNHEESHIRFRRHEDRRRATGQKNPMRPFTQVRREQNEALSHKDIEWMKALPLTIALEGGFVAVHGGFRPGLPVEDQDPNDVVRMRFLDKDTHKPLPLDKDYEQPPNSIFWSLVWRGPEHVLYGHAVQGDQPFHYTRKVDPPFELFRPEWPEVVHTVGLDTGCTFGGTLTALLTEDGFKTWDYVQVKAKRVYYEPAGGVHLPMWRQSEAVP